MAWRSLIDGMLFATNLSLRLSFVILTACAFVSFSLLVAISNVYDDPGFVWIFLMPSINFFSMGSISAGLIVALHAVRLTLHPFASRAEVVFSRRHWMLGSLIVFAAFVCIAPGLLHPEFTNAFARGMQSAPQFRNAMHSIICNSDRIARYRHEDYRPPAIVYEYGCVGEASPWRRRTYEPFEPSVET